MAVAGTLLGAALTGFVGANVRGSRENQLQKDAEDERRRLIREENEEYGTMG